MEFYWILMIFAGCSLISDRFEPALITFQEQTGSLVGRSLALLAGEVDFAKWHVFFAGERLDSEARLYCTV